MQVITIDFITAIFKALCDFLLTEPICYFTAISILICVGCLIDDIINRR